MSPADKALVATTLSSLRMALVYHGHQWSQGEWELYQQSMDALNKEHTEPGEEWKNG